MRVGLSTAFAGAPGFIWGDGAKRLGCGGFRLARGISPGVGFVPSKNGDRLWQIRGDGE